MSDDPRIGLPIILLAATAECSCGGRGPDDADACQACKVWHRVVRVVEARDKALNALADWGLGEREEARDGG
jgi:hypothetical protein